MSLVLESFCLYHITAPGQEPAAEDLPEDYSYPTMDELSEQVIINARVSTFERNVHSAGK